MGWTNRDSWGSRPKADRLNNRIPRTPSGRLAVRQPCVGPRDPRMRVNPPLYVASTRIHCWKCGAEMPAMALVAPDAPDGFGDVCVLSNI